MWLTSEAGDWACGSGNEWSSQRQGGRVLQDTCHRGLHAGRRVCPLPQHRRRDWVPHWDGILRPKEDSASEGLYYAEKGR